MQQVTSRRECYTPATQREIVCYRLRAHMDILVAALYLEVEDNDYNYMSMVLENVRVQLASSYSSDTED